MSDAKRKLSDCIRPTVEAAPWVIEAVLELENKLDAALEACKVKDEALEGLIDTMDLRLDDDDLSLETRTAFEALAIQPDDSALKDKAMTTYEQPKDWIERHLVEDPGGLLACEPSGLNEELKLARQANEFQHQTIKKQAAQIATMRETALNQQKREVMLRDALEYHQAQTRPIQRTEEALAATADLDGLILCDAVEVGWIGTGPRDGRCEFSESKPANSVMRDFNMKPLYRAWEPTK